LEEGGGGKEKKKEFRRRKGEGRDTTYLNFLNINAKKKEGDVRGEKRKEEERTKATHRPGGHNYFLHYLLRGEKGEKRGKVPEGGKEKVGDDRPLLHQSTNAEELTNWEGERGEKNGGGERNLAQWAQHPPQTQLNSILSFPAKVVKRNWKKGERREGERPLGMLLFIFLISWGGKRGKRVWGKGRGEKKQKRRRGHIYISRSFFLKLSPPKRAGGKERKLREGKREKEGNEGPTLFFVS